MFRKLTLSSFLTVCIFLASNFSYANIITVTGVSNAPYSLSPGDTLFIATGANYTGTVSGLNSNNKTIIVEGGAIFNPLSLAPTNGVVCKIKNYGTFTYSQSLTTNTDFSLDNYAGGVVNLADLSTKGKNQVWTNNVGGTINFSGPVSINGGTLADDNNVFINYETIYASSSFEMKSGSSFTNYKDFTVAGNYTANGGALRNEGNFVVNGVLEVKSGATPITNYCRMQASGGIKISNSTFTNYSYIWAKNSEIEITSGGITNISIAGANPPSPPVIHGASYKQSNGAVTGPALMYFYGNTSITGGTIGVLGATDTIKMNDITRTSPSTIFDNQAAGTVRPNVIYNTWGAPDSNRTYFYGCSIEIILEIPLAINWNSFDVDLFNNVPVLNWSAEFTQETVFEIQRSYDGRNFSPIKTLQYKEGQSDYEYNDITVNKQAAVAYYRIKAVEVSGVEKFTQTKMVRFSHKPGSIYIAPNPFTNNFIISYRAAERETIAIRILNVTGQQMLTKNVTVNNGINNITITEAAQFTRGIYVVQVSKGSHLISSGKIIKQ